MSFSPNLGRWVQVDPITMDAKDPNVYRAFDDNPSVVLDPEGLAGIDYTLNGEADPEAMRLTDGRPGYKFSQKISWALKDRPVGKNDYFLQANKLRTFGIKADGSTWTWPQADKDGVYYVVDSAALQGNTTEITLDESGFKFKEASFNKKDAWILLYHKVEKQSGFNVAGWIPSVKSGSIVKEGVYDTYIEKMRKNFGTGKMNYMYLYLNCANAKANKIDLANIEKDIPEDILPEVQAILKAAKQELKDAPTVEILSSAIFAPKNPVVGTFKGD